MGGALACNAGVLQVVMVDGNDASSVVAEAAVESLHATKYLDMLNDEPRNEAYDKAIRSAVHKHRAIQSKLRFLDIGYVGRKRRRGISRVID